MQIQKGYTGTDSDGYSYAKSQWKLVKFHLISIDISAKMGTVAIGIGIGTYIGIGIGSLETLLHIIIIAIFIGIRIGIGIGIGDRSRAVETHHYNRSKIFHSCLFVRNLFSYIPLLYDRRASSKKYTSKVKFLK